MRSRQWSGSGWRSRPSRGYWSASFRELRFRVSFADEHGRRRDLLRRVLGPNCVSVVSGRFIEAVGVPELRIELGHRISDRTFKHYAVAQSRQVDVGGEPVCDLQYRETRTIFRPDRFQGEPKTLRSQFLQDNPISLGLVV